MLTTIKGLYENGVVRPLEKVDIVGKAEVIITFLDVSKFRKKTFLSAAGSWKDIDTERIKKEIYKDRKVSTRKEAKL
jgi:predicted DNA-binding antitoxin AbrB/MazE fold protein